MPSRDVFLARHYQKLSRGMLGAPDSPLVLLVERACDGKLFLYNEPTCVENLYAYLTDAGKRENSLLKSLESFRPRIAQGLVTVQEIQKITPETGTSEEQARLDRATREEMIKFLTALQRDVVRAPKSGKPEWWRA